MRFEYQRLYEQMPEPEREAVHEAFRAATSTLRESGFHCPMDDRAEVLVDAIAAYLRSRMQGTST